nr:uncharacterized protein LOC108082456 isoform X4 [Drosophila kikkawai]
MLQPENTEDKSALLCLPDDALILILGYLDRRTQLMLTQMHIRFLTIMPNIWRSKYRSSCLSMIDDVFNSEKDFRYFMGSLQSTLNVLQMDLLFRPIFKILTSFVFPKVHDFQISSHPLHLDDTDMPSIIRSFPNLRTFAPHGRFSGKYFEGFHRLENLILTHCTSFEVSYLIRILRICRLKTLKLGVFERSQIRDTDLPLDGTQSLEVLQCNASEMNGWFLEKLKNFTQLKQLSLLDQFDNSFLQKVVVAANRSQFKSLEVNSQHALSTLLLSNYIQFEALKVCNVIISMNDEVLCFKNVKEIYLLQCNFLTNANFRFLMSLKSTEIVAIAECTFHFNKYTFVAKDNAQGRSKRLNLHLDPDMITYRTHPASLYDYFLYI